MNSVRLVPNNWFRLERSSRLTDKTVVVRHVQTNKALYKHVQQLLRQFILTVSHHPQLPGRLGQRPLNENMQRNYY